MKQKYKSFTIFAFILLLALIAIPGVLGKTRRVYLTSFILENEIEGVGFSNAIDNDNTVSFEATAYALNILKNYGIDPHDIETLKTNLEDDIEQLLNSIEVNIYDLFYLMKSLNIVDQDYEIDQSLENRIYKFVNDTGQIGGGFSYSNTSSSENLASTYYALQLYSLIDEPIANMTLHKNWVLSCNNSDGGYGGNQSLSSTLANTYYAISILNELDSVNDLVNINNTLSYLQSHYVLDSADLTNYGGYLPDEFAQFALLSSTYFCVKAVSLMDDTKLFKHSITTWVLSRQNIIDGGFAENTGGYQQKASSVIACYYAFETLKTLDSLYSLNDEIWMVEFNYWILIIVLGSIGLGIVALVYLWRRRRI
ncbi:MAG: prenyltransferase/squalene oxidase repeat-containing protein [Candidatus Hodarchaeota archaeon]